MSSQFDYRSYVTDRAFLDSYNAYQAKYAAQMRESDRVILGLVQDVIAARPSSSPARVLDIGCSTGNLLLHLHRAMPDLQLVGGDLALSSLEACRRKPELARISFERLDILDLPATERFDVVVVNAVLYMMSDAQFETALASIQRSLASGGVVLVFDFFHPFEQRLSMIEVSDSHPEGLALNFRPFSLVTKWLQASGYDKIEFRPFTLPIDLPRLNDPGLTTYTITTAEGVRLPFRGTLFQPWCHLRAHKA